MNSITIVGNLTRDAKTNQVGDNVVTNFSVADNQRVKGADVTFYYDCSLWGERGEKIAQYLLKGRQVTVIGTLTSEEKDGKTYLKVRVADVALPARGDQKPAEEPKPRPKPAETGDALDTEEIPF